jgi:hypothetical protein
LGLNLFPHQQSLSDETPVGASIWSFATKPTINAIEKSSQETCMAARRCFILHQLIIYVRFQWLVWICRERLRYFEAEACCAEPAFLDIKLKLLLKSNWPTFCSRVCSMATLNPAGVDMKKVFIGIAAAICITMGFTVCGSGNSPSSGYIPGMVVERIFSSENTPETPALQKQPARDGSIFSWTTILSLSMGVIGVVAIRRNTYA